MRSLFVAVIDDDEALCSSLADLMRSIGHCAEPFDSAEMFLNSADRLRFDCIIADVHMPGMTGVELHRHLVDAGYAIPTILVTAYPEEIVRDQALRDGVVCYLSKPVDDNHLERCLRSALRPGTPIEGNS